MNFIQYINKEYHTRAQKGPYVSFTILLSPELNKNSGIFIYSSPNADDHVEIWLVGEHHLSEVPFFVPP